MVGNIIGWVFSALIIVGLCFIIVWFVLLHKQAKHDIKFRLGQAKNTSPWIADVAIKPDSDSEKVEYLFADFSENYPVNTNLTVKDEMVLAKNYNYNPNDKNESNLDVALYAKSFMLQDEIKDIPSILIYDKNHILNLQEIQNICNNLSVEIVFCIDEKRNMKAYTYSPNDLNNKQEHNMIKVSNDLSINELKSKKFFMDSDITIGQHPILFRVNKNNKIFVITSEFDILVKWLTNHVYNQVLYYDNTNLDNCSLRLYKLSLTEVDARIYRRG